MKTADLLFNHVFRNYDLPEQMISDRGLQFISQVSDALVPKRSWSRSTWWHINSNYHLTSEFTQTFTCHISVPPKSLTQQKNPHHRSLLFEDPCHTELWLWLHLSLVARSLAITGPDMGHKNVTAVAFFRGHTAHPNRGMTLKMWPKNYPLYHLLGRLVCLLGIHFLGTEEL